MPICRVSVGEGIEDDRKMEKSSEISKDLTEYVCVAYVCMFCVFLREKREQSHVKSDQTISRPREYFQFKQQPKRNTAGKDITLITREAAQENDIKTEGETSKIASCRRKLMK